MDRRQDIWVKQGETKRIRINIPDLYDIEEMGYSIDDLTAVWGVARVRGSNLELKKNSTNDDVKIDAENKQVTIDLKYEDTKELLGEYFYECKLQDKETQEPTNYPVEGIFSVQKSTV